MKNAVISCACGKVKMEAKGEPVLTAACHCPDCHEGSRRIEALPKAPPILDDYGGTPHLLYRRDRIRFQQGEELLKRLKVDEDSPNRAYAACCNSYMFIEVPSQMPVRPIARARFQGGPPPIEMRLNFKRKPGEARVPTDVPCSSAFPFRFIRKVLGAQLAIILKR